MSDYITPEEAQELLEPCKCDYCLDLPERYFECVTADYGLPIDLLERMARTIIAVGEVLEEMEALQRDAFERFREEEEEADWGRSNAYSRASLMLRLALGVKDA